MAAARWSSIAAMAFSDPGAVADVEESLVPLASPYSMTLLPCINHAEFR